MSFSLMLGGKRQHQMLDNKYALSATPEQQQPQNISILSVF